jgi:hypothetical protein
MKKKTMQQEIEVNINAGISFERLLDRKLFSWGGQALTLKQAIFSNASRKAQEVVSSTNLASSTSPQAIIDKVSPRAESWGYLNYLDHFKLSATVV